MAVSITQDPGDYNLAYGVNALTLTGITPGSKYVMQVWDSGLTNKLADVRQSPNVEGKAIFDIQNILQSYITGSKKDLETITQLATSADETVRYYIKFGSETAAGAVTIDGTSTVKEAFGGRKEYFEIDWDPETYQCEVSGNDANPVCTVIDQKGKPLTDLPTCLADSMSGFNPYGSDPIYCAKVTDNDHLTVSFLSKLNRNASAVSQAQGIEAFQITFYNGDTYNGFLSIPNIESNGGGPNNAVGDGESVTDPYSIISVGLGPQNITIPANTTHYYVTTRVWTNCTPNNLLDYGHTPVRVDIVEANCNDYDHIRVSWTNSYGMRDYYSFTKRNEKRIRIKRNTYLQESADYASTSYTTNRYDRGTTTFSQKLDMDYTASTDWVSDEDAIYLENLFVSPDVRVKIGDGEWQPVTLTSNSYTERNYRKDRLFQYQIQFRAAHGLKSQRG